MASIVTLQRTHIVISQGGLGEGQYRQGGVDQRVRLRLRNASLFGRACKQAPALFDAAAQQPAEGECSWRPRRVPTVRRSAAAPTLRAFP